MASFNPGQVGSLFGKLPLRNLVGIAGEAALLPSAAKNAVNAAVGLYETGEGLIRGGFNKQNIKSTLERSNTPGYQSLPPALNAIQTGKYGPTDWNPSANPVAQPPTVDPASQARNQDAANRSYEIEKRRIAQQTAQNPLFQKYEVADLTKQYNSAKNPAEKQRLGLEIWAQTNPLLAARLSSGQVGYAESRTAPGMSNSGGAPIGGLPMPTTRFDAAAAMATPGTMEQTFGTPVPGVGMVSTTPMVYNLGTPEGPVTDGMVEASYSQQLLSSPDFAKVAKDSAFLRRAYLQQGLK
jgi:hypothetical protein